jgi:hypothetical protein
MPATNNMMYGHGGLELRTNIEHALHRTAEPVSLDTPLRHSLSCVCRCAAALYNLGGP